MTQKESGGNTSLILTNDRFPPRSFPLYSHKPPGLPPLSVKSQELTFEKSLISRTLYLHLSQCVRGGLL